MIRPRNFLGKYEVEQADNYLGIRYWKQKFRNTTPSFKVFYYLGCCRKTEDLVPLYFFIEWGTKSPVILIKKHDELNTDDFSPFLLNFTAIEREFPKGFNSESSA